MSLSTFYLVTSDGITFFCKLQILTFHLCFEPKGLLTASNTRHQCKGFVVRFDFVRNQQRQIIVTSHDLGPQLVVFHKGNFRKKNQGNPGWCIWPEAWGFHGRNKTGVINQPTNESFRSLSTGHPSSIDPRKLGDSMRTKCYWRVFHFIICITQWIITWWSIVLYTSLPKSRSHTL